MLKPRWIREDPDRTYIEGRINYWANKHVKSFKLDEEEHMDIAQELSIVLFANLPKFDPARASRHTYIARVIENHAKTLVSARVAAKRNARRVKRSLDTPIDTHDPESETYQDRLSADHYRGGRCVRVSSEDEWDLACSLTETIAKMPESLKQITVLIYEGYSITDIAQILDINRSTVYERMGQIRRRMQEGGIK